MSESAASNQALGEESKPKPFQYLADEIAFIDCPRQQLRLLIEGAIEMPGVRLQEFTGVARRTISETLAAAYRAKGDRFLEELAGSFRLAIWDDKKQKLLVAVDPFATKPVYYSCANGTLYFAPRFSRLAGVSGISNTIDPNILYFYLNHSFIPAPFSVYRDVHRLEPGQYLSWHNNALTVQPYWDLEYEEDFDMSLDGAANLVRASVERSISSNLQAQPIDFSKVGAFLSGGTDSSTIVGLMTKTSGQRIKTFSVGFAEEQYNEIEYARVAAARYNSEAHEYFVSADEALSVLPGLAAQFDEPFGNSSAVPTYFCLRMAKDAGVDFMFAGDGGDEIFGGNTRYVAEKYFIPFDILPNWLQRIGSRAASMLPWIYPLSKIRRYIERASEGNPKRFFHYQTYLSDQAEDFFVDDFVKEIERDFVLYMPRNHYEKVQKIASLNRLLYMDMKMCIADNDLFKVNQMASASGVRVCYPFLDRDLAVLTGKIPAAFKVKGLQKRFVFKKAFQDLLPEEILRKTKHGFGLPIARWLRSHSGFRELVRSLLLDQMSLQRGIVKPKAIEDLLDKHDKEKSDFYGTFIWNLMMLELWFRNSGK